MVLEEGIESIEARAFSNSHFIGNLTIPNSVTRINWEAFINCDKFNGKLNLGKVEYIATGAFTNCSGFTGDLVIPEELSSIGQNAFQNCTGFDGKLYVGQKVYQYLIMLFKLHKDKRDCRKNILFGRGSIC